MQHGEMQGYAQGRKPRLPVVLPQQTELQGNMKEVEAGSVVRADVLGLVGCTRAGSRRLCDVGLRNDPDRGGNMKQ